MLRMIGTRMMRITRIFHGFDPFRLFDFLSKPITKAQFLFKQKAFTKIVEHLAQKIRENPRYLRHPRSYHT